MTTAQSYRAYLNQVQDLTLGQGWAVSNPHTREFLRNVDAWGFPKYPDRTVILPPTADFTTSLENFVRVSTLQFKEADCWLGTWIYPRTGEVYLDITTSCLQLSDALELTAQINAASRRKIIAVYNSQLDKTVYL